MSNPTSIEPIGAAHVCLVVSDLNRARNFYLKVLGLQEGGQPHIFKLGNRNEVHACEVPNPKGAPGLLPMGWTGLAELPVTKDSWAQRLNHLAINVKSIQTVSRRLLENHIPAFQMDENGNRKDITSAGQSLSFGLRTVYCYDPDGNLLEFMDEQSNPNG